MNIFIPLTFGQTTEYSLVFFMAIDAHVANISPLVDWMSNNGSSLEIPRCLDHNVLRKSLIIPTPCDPSGCSCSSRRMMAVSESRWPSKDLSLMLADCL